ncbi:MAG: hypothetical protein AAB426_06895 [Myxococcota bacterium]
MTKIRWRFDSDGPIDVIDPLGAVYIDGLEGASIGDGCTNIDVFFFALIALVRELRVTDEARIDLVIEPAPLVGSLQTDGSLRLQYGAQTVTVESVDDLEHELRIAVRAFLAAMPADAPFGEDPLAVLQRFVGGMRSDPDA